MTVDPFKPITLAAEGASLTATVLSYGLTIHSISTEDDEDFISGPEDPQDHNVRGRSFLNPIIGRFANRLPAGKVEYKSANGKTTTITLAEFSGAGVVLHGGPQSDRKNKADSLLQHGPFDQCYWQPLDTKDSKFFTDSGFSSTSSPSEKQSSLIFAIESPDGDSGYPGQLRVETLLAVVPSTASDSQIGKSAGKFLIRYRAALCSEGSVEATPLNLTHHWGFNLSASNENAGKKEKGTVSEHVVQMYPPAGKSLYQLDLDSAMIATGNLNESCGADESFSNPGSHHWDKQGGKRVDENSPSAGYDDFYVWGLDTAIPQSDDVDKIATEATKRMRVTSESAGRSITFYTNQAGAQLYTAEGQPKHPADSAKSGGVMKKAHRKGGLEESGNFKRSYVAIEFGGPHCGFLRQGLAHVGGREEILEKGQVYDNWVVLEAWKK
ncbi:uncharacterized protein MEPE_01766 [Melanopsichium pennsylvanicum]|uniref:Galactose mutarotase-like protein n=2 Tax=Melanopsichium pennsylvanicum TaxID=63383 RepID=A0AAJ4XIC4_9BASI|nr:galactose mutarotase-like protein [Melanopsichium pennsylvanicum 4]SNX83060.1 uncharacterized protein MEPE_01766 [Melanopsichium pennsylvanicum]